MQTLFDGLFRFFSHVPGISHLAFVLLQWVGLGNDAAELVPRVSLIMMALIIAVAPFFIRFVAHLFLMGKRVSSSVPDFSYVAVKTESGKTRMTSETWRDIANIEELLAVYRKKLAPGIYYFEGRYDNGNLVGISEVKESYSRPEFEEEYGVTFGFYEKGSPTEEELKTINHVQLSKKYPFISVASELYKTSAGFREQLTIFLKARLSTIE